MMKVWTALLVCGAAVSVVVWAVALLRENGVCPFAAVTRFVRGLPLGGRLAVLPLFAALVVYGSVKNHSNERGEMSNEIGSESGFNRVDRVEGDESGFNAETQSSGDAQSGDLDNVANVEMLPMANTNSQLGNGEWVTGNGSDLNNSHLSSPIAHISSLITEGDCEAGFVLSGVGYGEEFDFAPPENAVVCEDWLRFGAHEDWFHLPLGWFSFPFGSNVVEKLTVLSSGTLYPATINASTFIAPLKASLGIVPMANWERIVFGRVDRVDGCESVFNAETRCARDEVVGLPERSESEGPQGAASSGDAQSGDGTANVANMGMLPMTNTNSQLETGNIGTGNTPNSQLPTYNSSLFWHCFTPSNTVVFTWQNVLLERDIGKPVSFQCEISHTGDFIFRYDLKSIATTNEVPFPKVEIGAKNSAQGVLIDSTAATSNLCDTLRLCDSRTLACPSGSTSSNLPDEAELLWRISLKTGTLSSLRFSHLDRQDYLVPDRDDDGLSTADEIFIHRTDPGNADTDMDGLSDGEEVNETETDPLNLFSINPLLPDGIAIALGTADPFSFPPGSTNTVLEHLFYTGTLDGEIAYPEETDNSAVLEIYVSGSGSGVLQVGGVSVPLVAPQASAYSRTRSAPSSTPLCVALQKGVTHPVFLMGDSSLSVAFGSSGFAFGELPSLAEGRFMGWINFPNTKATSPCIHDFYACDAIAMLPTGENAEGLTCTWSDADDVQVKNLPPRSASFVGKFSPKSQSSVSYELDHPKALFGTRSYTQTVRFCPRLEEDEEDVDSESSLEEEEDETWQPCECGEDCSLCGGSCEDGCLCEAPDPAICDEHDCPYEECREQHESDYEDASILPRYEEVLYIRDPVSYSQLPLDVPSGARTPCCPCVEHAINYVTLSYASPSLSVMNQDGSSFHIATESCDVLVGGVSPSKTEDSSRLLFATNGATYLDLRYTVLGVGISGNGQNLDALNAYAPQFGLPIIVGTNSPTDNLKLELNVALDNGHVRLAFEDVSGAFKIVYWNQIACEWQTLIDSESRPVRDISINEWRRLFNDAGAFSSSVAVISTAEGCCDLKFSYWTVINGQFVEDVAIQRITAVNPPLIPDMNFDGQIDDADVAEYIKGRLFRYWFNEDTVKGDYDGHIPDYTRNAADSVVNGRYDLVNLFAASLDLKPFIDAWGTAVRFELSAYGEDTMRYCAVNVNPNEVGKIYTDDTFTRNANVPLHSAPLTALQYDAMQINPSELLGEGNAPGILAFEAAASHENVTLWVKLGDETILSFPMPISISSVRDMYRWNNLRHICGGVGGDETSIGMPWNFPDDESNGKDVFFLHGFNVSADSARNWANQIFKRLWLSGSRAKFHGIAWYGDYRIGEDMNPVEKMNAFFYHRDVYNALQTASSFKTYVENCQLNASSRIVMAHSLGNMVASESLRLGLNVAKYFMFNAAVASEAYDATLHNQDAQTKNSFVPQAWRDYDSRSWAANWHLWFPSDDRNNLRWKGLFANALANVGEICNYYSSGDEVLESDESVPDMFSNVLYLEWPISFSWSWPFLHFQSGSFQFTFERNAWQKQEVLKGVNPYLATREGGWGFHSRLSLLGTHETISPNEAAGMIANGSIVTNAVFERSVSAMFKPSNTSSETYNTIAYNIPAVSCPAGSVATMNDADEFHDMNSDFFRNGWGRNDIVYGRQWLHSDVKNMAYWYVFKIFTELGLKMQGELR